MSFLKDSSISIYEAMMHIKEGRYVMPAFQRQFVWSMEQIEKLWDSILLNYPIATFLFWHVDDNNVTWDTYFCNFLTSVTFDNRKQADSVNYELTSIDVNTTDTAILDGQQRLTSLYLSLFGDSYIREKYARRNTVGPAAGSAGFLVEAGEYLKRNNEDLFAIKELKDHYNNDMFFGNDMDRTMLRIGAMNMMLHGVEKPNIEYRDSLSEKNIDDEKYTLVLANPPFKGSLDHESVAADLLKITKTKKTELLFLALFLRTLKKGGRCASIVPDGVLFGSSNAHKSIRKEIVENHHLHGIISMPSGVFKPYAGVSTAIMIFTKTGAGGTDNVWFYDMHADGLSLDDKRQPVESNDIPDIISRYHNLENEKNRKRTEKSFYVTKKEIKDNGYDLSINKYKEVEYDRVEYEKPSVIMNRIDEIDSEIDNLKAELKTLLNLDL